VIARIGESEFAVLLDASPASKPSRPSLKRWRPRASAPIFAENTEIFLTSSVGNRHLPDDSKEPDQLLQQAGAALAVTRHERRGAARFMRPELNIRSLERLGLEAELRRAIERPN
jgi:predicted signal transduction protein with EAL and GGDEF domain